MGKTLGLLRIVRDYHYPYHFRQDRCITLALNYTCPKLHRPYITPAYITLHVSVTSILSRRRLEFLNSCPASVADPWQGSEALWLGNNNVLNVSDAKEHRFPDTPHFRSERAISAISFNRSICRCLVTFCTVWKEYGCVSEIFSDLTDTWECKYSALSPDSGPYWSSDAGPATRTLSYSLEATWLHGHCSRLCSSDARARNDYVQPQDLAGARQKFFHWAGEGREACEA